MPIWLSSRNTGYISDSYKYTAWMNNKLLVWGSEFEMIFIKEDNYKSVVSKIADYNGYTKNIPLWLNSGIILEL